MNGTRRDRWECRNLDIRFYVKNKEHHADDHYKPKAGQYRNTKVPLLLRNMRSTLLPIPPKPGESVQ
jgi:hypothetical protein